MLIKQLSIFVENKSGRVAQIAAVIAGAGIDIRALSIADTTDFGILRLIVDKPERAEQVLKDAGMTVSLTNVIAIGFPDQPGGFAGAMKALADRSIDIEYMYAFNSRNDGRACIILCASDSAAALDALRAGGVEILPEERIYTQ